MLKLIKKPTDQGVVIEIKISTMLHYSLDTIERKYWGISLSDYELKEMERVLKYHPYDDKACTQIHYKKTSTESNPEQLMIFLNIDGRSYDRILNHRHFSIKPIACRQMTVLEWCEIAGSYRMEFFKYLSWEDLIENELKYIDQKFGPILRTYKKKYRIDKRGLELVEPQKEINFFQV